MRGNNLNSLLGNHNTTRKPSLKMVELGLNSHHQSVLLSYMKFARYLRGQSLKTVQDGFKNATAALYEDTYTQDEVRKILDDLQTILTCDCEAEMCSFTHNNVLMLQQLFKQAETWHLRMEVQLSELQNKDLLEMIQQLELDETVVKPAVERDDGESSLTLLRLEIDRLRTENELLRDEQQDCVDKLEQTQEELNAVRSKLQQASSQMQDYRVMAAPVAVAGDDGKVKEMAEKLRMVEQALEMDQETSRSRQITLQTELHSTREQVAKVQSQLKLAEMELERKFSETKAYANMKQILMNKNARIKKLRSKLNEILGEDKLDSGDDGDNED